MGEQPGSGDMPSDRRGQYSQAEHEVGRITLGARRFAVLVMPDKPCRALPHLA